MSASPDTAPGEAWAQADAMPLAGDASARRYRRLRRPDGATAIEMTDPDPAAFAAFARVARHLRKAGLSVPRILETAPVADSGGVCAIVEDFGDLSLARLLETDPGTAAQAYAAAAALPDRLAAAGLPAWAARPAAADLAGMVGITLSRAGLAESVIGHEVMAALTERMQALVAGDGPPPGLSLRDYHADNLMWLPQRDGLRRLGLLDFQDAVILPAGYDLASLFDDPRRDVPLPWRDDALRAFAARHGLTFHQAQIRIDSLSVLRNLRILGIFDRLATEAGRPAYARFLPRTWALIDRASAGLPELAPALAALRAATASWGSA